MSNILSTVAAAPHRSSLTLLPPNRCTSARVRPIRDPQAAERDPSCGFQKPCSQPSFIIRLPPADALLLQLRVLPHPRHRKPLELGGQHDERDGVIQRQRARRNYGSFESWLLSVENEDQGEEEEAAA